MVKCEEHEEDEERSPTFEFINFGEGDQETAWCVAAQFPGQCSTLLLRGAMNPTAPNDFIALREVFEEIERWAWQEFYTQLIYTTATPWQQNLEKFLQDFGFQPMQEPFKSRRTNRTIQFWCKKLTQPGGADPHVANGQNPGL